MTELDLGYLRSWVGRSESAEDIVDARRVAQMAGSLGLSQAPAVGDSLPMPWHWLFFTPITHATTTGSDGHPARGGFLPPVPLPRRMWAGSEVVCHGPLRIGDRTRRESRIASVEAKRGKGGNLLFVTVEHALYAGGDDPVIEEQQSIVYREPATVVASDRPAAVDHDMPIMSPQWETTVVPDPVMLFRYSALTFNAHRIHYDREYAVNEEGYAGLVVQGPLIASLLLKFAYDNLGLIDVREFSFRARRPLFDSSPMVLCGAREDDLVTLWALTPERELAMRLTARLPKD
jgi:3-methylfumaryl-CoA hydratase